jgi:hypothetical protein
LESSEKRIVTAKNLRETKVRKGPIWIFSNGLRFVR